MKSEVVILSCESYEEELVYSTLKKGIALLGGWETFLKKEEKILLKPNLVRKTEVERAVITHPAVVKGIVRLLQEEGYVHLSCGDSCGVGSAKKVMEGTGMDQMLDLGLQGKADSAQRRAFLGTYYHLGRPNAKTLLRRLNMLGVQADEVKKVLSEGGFS